MTCLAKFLLRINDGFYQYGEEKAPSIAWHVNFADSQLFRYYGGTTGRLAIFAYFNLFTGQLFAQDEILVAEHPLLAALREALAALSDAFPLTAPKTREALVKGSNEECATPSTRPSCCFINNFLRFSFDTQRAPHVHYLGRPKRVRGASGGTLRL